MLVGLCGRGCAVAVEAGVLGAGAAAFKEPGMELAASSMESDIEVVGGDAHAAGYRLDALLGQVNGPNQLGVLGFQGWQ